jgi:hypothetical protein
MADEAAADGQNDLRAKIMAIMRDTSLSDAEKSRKRQELMCGGWAKPAAPADKSGARRDQPARLPLRRGGVSTAHACRGCCRAV